MPASCNSGPHLTAPATATTAATFAKPLFCVVFVVVVATVPGLVSRTSLSTANNIEQAGMCVGLIQSHLGDSVHVLLWQMVLAPPATAS